ncbi:MAG: nucleoside monophosphate kinase [Patescibacteria group bacterium]|nr:nucleoside monophosphate kinase [Patescibacteria group bacterium]
MLNIIITGPQGSGKGTQAKLLAKRYNLEHIEAGKLLRDLVKMGNPAGQKINPYLLRGTLVPTRILIEEVLKPRLSKVPSEKGLVFDGIPRRLREAKALEEILASLGRKISYVFYIEISEKETYKRLGKRLTCKGCSRSFILGVDVADPKEQCPHCGSVLYQREDDTEAAIRKRLEIFKCDTIPVIEYFRKKNLVTRINGEQSIKKVHEDIIAVIGK